MTSAIVTLCAVLIIVFAVSWCTAEPRTRAAQDRDEGNGEGEDTV